MEATFAGPNYGELKGCHLNIGHLLEIGSNLCEAIAQFTLSPEFARDFRVPLDAISLAIPSEFDVNTTELAGGDDLDNDDMSSGSDDDDIRAVVPITTSDSLDEFIVTRQQPLTVKGLQFTSKTSNPTKNNRSYGQNDVGKRPQESLRLIAGKSAMAVIKRRAAAAKRNGLTNDSRLCGEETMQKLDNSLLSQSYHSMKVVKSKSK